MTIAVVGNVTLDVCVAASFEAAIPGEQVNAKIGFQAGGGAANVATWLTALEENTEVVAPIGDDPAGSVLAALVPWQPA